MKKTLLIATILLALFSHAEAQFKYVSSGPSFDEPQKGASKLIMLKDGSVVFLTIIPKEAIDIRVYNKEHKEIAVASIIPALSKFKSPILQAAFEINKDVILLISDFQDKSPVLLRLIIDGTTGKLKKEEKIGELKKLNLGQGYAMAFGNVESPGFYVSKDPDSENYAVALFNSFESDRNKRIEIIHYNDQHQEINRGYYTSPEDKYKYLDFLSMAVMGAEKVSVMVSGYNTPAHGGKSSEILLGNLENGASTFSFTDLRFPKDSLIENGIVRYNPYLKKFIVIAKMYAKGEKEAQMYLAFVDPFSKLAKLTQTGVSQRIADKAADIYGRKYKYSGTPVNLHIRKDGGFVVIYEAGVTISGSPGSYGGSSSYRVTEGIVTVAYDKNGQVKHDYMVPKNFMMDEAGYVMRSISFRNEYKKFAFIDRGEQSYIFINDTERNIELVEKNKQPVIVQGVDECDAFYFPLTGSEAIPQRKYLFGDPENKKDHNRALFDISAYDQQNDLFVVLQLQKEGRGKSVNLVWLKPQ